jgi:hypothetical protein
MPNQPAVTHLRPFVPAKNFAQSKEFYKALGFETVAEWQGGALFAAGNQSFVLQNFYKKELAENFMLQLVVPDLDAWWKHIESQNLVERFQVRAPKAPEMQPWGMRVAFLFDPSPVLWHVAQA